MNKRAQATNRIDKYRDSYGVPWEEHSAGFLVIPVLKFLQGQPLNNLALNYIHALRPSSVRATSNGWLSCDARPWRVTIILKKDNKTINYIEQEVEVGLYGANHGDNLSRQLKEQKGE